MVYEHNVYAFQNIDSTITLAESYARAGKRKKAKYYLEEARKKIDKILSELD